MKLHNRIFSTLLAVILMLGALSSLSVITVGAAEADALQRAFAERFGRTIHRIGRITESAAPDIRWMEHGREITPPWRGFTHF